MKKNIYSIALLAFCNLAIAQVGIGTDSPQTSLHIVSNSNKSTTFPDGIIPPSLSKTQLANKENNVYGKDHIGTIIFVNEIGTVTSGKSLNQVVNINTKGYYYFDGNFWVKLSGGDTSDDAWINNSSAQRVELFSTSTGQNRSAGSEVVVKDNGALGLGNNNPRTKLDLNGTYSNNEQVYDVTSNTTIPSISQAQLSLIGNPLNEFSIVLPAGVPGQKLVIVNNTTSSKDGKVGQYFITNNNAVEFIYSNGSWKALGSGIKSNVSIYGTTLPILPHANVRSGTNYKNLTNASLDIMSPGGDGMWHVVNQTNFKSDLSFSSSVGFNAASRKIVEYEYSGSPFDATKVYPIVTPGNNSSNYGDVFSANVVSFETVNGKTRLKLSIVRSDYSSDTSTSAAQGYPVSTSDWQGSFYVNILLATKN